MGTTSFPGSLSRGREEEGPWEQGWHRYGENERLNFLSTGAIVQGQFLFSWHIMR